MENKENQINIELSDEIAEGIYSNLAIISHSSSEFVVDFVRIMPGTSDSHTRTCQTSFDGVARECCQV
jgi:hypothetical protein